MNDHNQPIQIADKTSSAQQVLFWLHTYAQRKRFIFRTNLILDCLLLLSASLWLAVMVSALSQAGPWFSWSMTVFMIFSILLVQYLRWLHRLRQKRWFIVSRIISKINAQSTERERLPLGASERPPLPSGEGRGEGVAVFGYPTLQDLFALRPSPVLADSATLCQGERGFSEATLGIELAQQSLAHDDIQGKLVEHVCQHTFKQLTRLDITRLLPSHGLLIRAGMLLVSLLMTAYICRQTAPWYIQQLPIQSSIDNDTAVAFNNDQRLILHAPHHVESVNSDTTLSLIMEANVSADELIANLQLAISINHLPPTCLPLPTAGTLMTADAKQYEHAISLSELNLNPGDQLALTARMQIRSANTSQWVESQPQVIHIQSIHESQSATITNAPSSFAANHQGSGQNQGNSGGSSSPAGHSNTSTNQTVSQHPMLPTIHTTNSLASGELVTPTTPSAPTITIESVPEVPLRYREMTNAYLTQLAIDSARTLTPNTTTPPSDGSTPP